jgi:hypothetical protein
MRRKLAFWNVTIGLATVMPVPGVDADEPLYKLIRHSIDGAADSE